MTDTPFGGGGDGGLTAYITIRPRLSGEFAQEVSQGVSGAVVPLASSGRTHIPMHANTTGLEEEVGKAFDRLGQRAVRLGEYFGVAFAGKEVFDFFKSGAEGAEQLEVQSRRAVDVVGQRGAQQFQAFADTSVKSLGLSRQAALDLENTLATISEGFGTTKDEAAKQATELSRIIGNVAAEQGKPAQAVADAFESAVRGGRITGLNELGLHISEADVQREASKLGLFTRTAADPTQVALVQDRIRALQREIAQGARGPVIDPEAVNIASRQVESAQARVSQALSEAHGVESDKRVFDARTALAQAEDRLTKARQGTATSTGDLKTKQDELAAAEKQLADLQDGKLDSLTQEQKQRAIVAALIDDNTNRVQRQAPAIDQASAAWQNFKTEVGENVLPEVNKLLLQFTGYVEDNGPTIQRVAHDIGDGFRDVGDGLRWVVDHKEAIGIAVAPIAGLFLLEKGAHKFSVGKDILEDLNKSEQPIRDALGRIFRKAFPTLADALHIDPTRPGGIAGKGGTLEDSVASMRVVNMVVERAEGIGGGGLPSGRGGPSEGTPRTQLPGQIERTAGEVAGAETGAEGAAAGAAAGTLLSRLGGSLGRFGSGILGAVGRYGLGVPAAGITAADLVNTRLLGGSGIFDVPGQVVGRFRGDYGGDSLGDQLAHTVEWERTHGPGGAIGGLLFGDRDPRETAHRTLMNALGSPAVQQIVKDQSSDQLYGLAEYARSRGFNDAADAYRKLADAVAEGKVTTQKSLEDFLASGEDYARMLQMEQDRLTQTWLGTFEGRRADAAEALGMIRRESSLRPGSGSAASEDIQQGQFRRGGGPVISASGNWFSVPTVTTAGDAPGGEAVLNRPEIRELVREGALSAALRPRADVSSERLDRLEAMLEALLTAQVEARSQPAQVTNNLTLNQHQAPPMHDPLLEARRLLYHGINDDLGVSPGLSYSAPLAGSR